MEVAVFHRSTFNTTKYSCISAPPEFLCKLASGVGSGNSEKRIGDQTGDDCARACMTEKKTDDTINGVTIKKDGSAGCWCEIGIKRTVPSDIYNTCIFKPGKVLPVNFLK